MIQEDNGALVWRSGGESLRIEPWGQDSLRVRATLAAELRSDLVSALLPRPAGPPGETAQVEIEAGGAAARLRHGRIEARLDAEGRLEYFNSQTGLSLLRELRQHADFLGPKAREYRPVGGDLYHTSVGFNANPGERLYGLGQQQDGFLDLKGCVIELLQRNTKVSIPFLLSSRGYGFLWNSPAVGRVELGQNATRWVAEASRQVDYWITAGDAPAQIVERYVHATGLPPLLPEWAAGFWQSKLRYKSQAELLEVARRHKSLGLPLDVIVIDGGHWTLQGDWRFDPAEWPDPQAMVDELRKAGIEVMVSIWPTVNGLSPNYKIMQEQGLLVRSEQGVLPLRMFQDNQPPGPVAMAFYDPTNPAARQFIWEQVRRGYHRYGIRLFWLDADEPEIEPVHPWNLRFHLGAGMELFNAYPLFHQQAFADGLRQSGENEIILLSRSAWAGSQRFGAAVWSGDILSTFEALRRQVRAGLNIALSGIPWWTTDIGGFLNGDPESDEFRELIVRWFQYGVFCPLFRLHGFRQPASGWTGGPNELWSFGEAAFPILREQLLLRERLKPYILAQMRLAHQRGTPPMRPLFYDFPDDTIAWGVDDEFLFGPSVLVAPIVEAGARQRAVYMPAGAEWKDAWSGEIFEGGQVVEADAPIERIPVYTRDGAALPLRPQG
jgi:alpha-D-xyloside xylohydrolase